MMSRSNDATEVPKKGVKRFITDKASFLQTAGPETD